MVRCPWLASYWRVAQTVLVVPTVTEQHMLGERVEALGVGRLVRPDDLEGVIGGLVRLLRENRYRKAAAAFKARYASVNRENIVSGVVTSIERCLGAA